MVPDPHDRWLFLLAIAPLPLGCTTVIYVDPPADDSSSGGTTTPMPMSDTSEGATSIVTTTGVDGTSSGETTAATGTTDVTGASSSDSTTMPIEPGSSSSAEEGSSTTGELGLCEAWGESRALCYGYYNAAYWTMLCYSYLGYVDPACATTAQHYYGCQAYGGCFADCSTEYDMQQACELGCNTIPVVPGAGTIEMQCTGIAAQATACDMAGYYIPGFSQYVGYPPELMVNFCTNGAYFVFWFAPPAVGDPCGGAYEELLTCLSGLTCSEFADEIFFGNLCAAERDAVECRCDLGA